MAVNDFDPVSTELNQGVSLIEASAGTGKTFTIAMLALRMVVELDIPIDKILVVTFTKAATEELKTRIRNRLTETKSLLINQNLESGNPISEWLERLDLTPKIIQRRLELALLDIDQAGIFTIHGFCQRVLSEHALASGQLFDAELTDDLAAIKQACVDDFWRREIQNQPAWETALLTKDINTPEELLKSIDGIHANAIVYPQECDLEKALSTVDKAIQAAAFHFSQAFSAIEPHVQDKVFKDNFKKNFSDNCLNLNNWLTRQTYQVPDLETLAIFSGKYLKENLNGTQFKSTKTHTGEERKAEFIDSLAIDTQPFDNLVDAMATLTLALRRKLLDDLRKILDEELERRNVWTFDSLITHLAKALQSKQGAELTDELRHRFSAALIDEFQDTDNDQWLIFSTLFATPSHYLMLVGDPKQAIYKFRGADIFSYLAAQQHAQYQYTLRNNWRSHPLLVTGVNRLFNKSNAFFLEKINFTPAISPTAISEETLFNNNQPVAPFEVWQLPESDSNNGYWQHGNQADEVVRNSIVNEILSLLSGRISLQPSNTNIAPQDIAILVRSNQQARNYQQTLAVANIPAVLTSTESVFNTEDATQLFKLLESIAHPGNLNLLTQALALDWFGCDGQALHQLLRDEQRMDGYSIRFFNYFQLWQQKGVMTMFQTLLQQENLLQHMTQSQYAERRLTNIQHILEILQQASLDHHLGLHKTLAWLKNSIINAQSKGNTENHQLRLENDADAVKIVTMHRSKGLEYPIVFCPFLWQGNNLKNKKPFIQCHIKDIDGTYQAIADLGSSDYEQHFGQQRFEQQAEDVRLAYVAMTRAKYRCYIVWADVRTKDAANQSALSWLLGLGERNFNDQQTILQKLQTDNPDIFSYRLLEKTEAITDRYQAKKPESTFLAKKLQRSLFTDWQMSSYTALSALSVNETPELPKNKADELPDFAIESGESLPSGAHTGNVIHELLEILPFKDLARKADISELRNQISRRYGLRLTQPETIDNLLCNVVSTSLALSDENFRLMNLQEHKCLKEMPFYLSLSSANTENINLMLRDESTFQPLTSKKISGYLTGFIDLICEYDGRYYVMDYKTNTLPNYMAETLTDAMREHNYGLQYWLYCVVLHRYLQTRLPGYSYEKYFGGVRYLFVRGMQPDVPMSGVFHAHPDISKLDALSALFRA